MFVLNIYQISQIATWQMLCFLVLWRKHDDIWLSIICHWIVSKNLKTCWEKWNTNIIECLCCIFTLLQTTFTCILQTIPVWLCPTGWLYASRDDESTAAVHRTDLSTNTYVHSYFTRVRVWQRFWRWAAFVRR